MSRPKLSIGVACSEALSADAGALRDCYLQFGNVRLALPVTDKATGASRQE